MAFAFPTSPATDATTTNPANGAVYRWDGQKWVAADGAGGATLDMSPTAPSPAPDGILWFDTASVNLFIRYNGQWVPVSNPPR